MSKVDKKQGSIFNESNCSGNRTLYSGICDKDSADHANDVF